MTLPYNAYALRSYQRLLVPVRHFSRSKQAPASRQGCASTKEVACRIMLVWQAQLLDRDLLLLDLGSQGSSTDPAGAAEGAASGGCACLLARYL